MDIDYEKELFICDECAKDSKLKKYILQNSTQFGRCSICQETDKTILDILDNPSFYNFLRALIRYHFWEDEYNRHFGGDDIQELIENNQAFINAERIVDNEVLDYLMHGIHEYTWYDENIIELYFGRDDSGSRGSFGQRLKDKKDSSLQALEDKLLKENYFLFEEDVIQTILTYKDYFKSELQKDSIFYRGRIGYADKVKNDLSFFDYTDEDSYNKYIPYTHNEISAPPPYMAVNAGRLNRQGVSFLYLATDIDTAIAELRPHPGHKVSIGSFKCKKDLKIVDFDIAFIRLADTEKTLNKFTYLNHIDQLFSRPITPNERHLYIITQFFADIFRKIGFDGISFSSSVGNGQNILIFDPSNFVYIEKDAGVYGVTGLKYSTKALV